MVLLLTEVDVKDSLNMKSAVSALERALEQQKLDKVIMPSRMKVQVEQGRMMLMPVAINGTGFMGLKIFTVFEKIRFLFVLFGSKDGQLLALIDADYLGQIRTGATSALATKLLSKRDSRNIGILGSGAQARTQLEGICAVRNVKQVKVFSPNPDHKKSYIDYASRILGLNALPAQSAEEAIKGADVIATATSSKEPIVRGNWLENGTHINAIGSTLSDRRELDDSAILRCNLIVVDSKEQVLNESGDLRIPIKKGIITAERVFELWEIHARKSNRRNDSDITLFKSVGTALQDLAVAAEVYESAIRKGLGKELGGVLTSRPAAAS